MCIFTKYPRLFFAGSLWAIFGEALLCKETIKERKDFLAVITQRWDQMSQEPEFPSLEKSKQRPMTYCQDVIEEGRGIR